MALAGGNREVVDVDKGKMCPLEEPVKSSSGSTAHKVECCEAVDCTVPS